MAVAQAHVPGRGGGPSLRALRLGIGPVVGALRAGVRVTRGKGVRLARQAGQPVLCGNEGPLSRACLELDEGKGCRAEGPWGPPRRCPSLDSA